MRLSSLPQKTAFEQMHLGKKVNLFYLKAGALQAAFTNYGARLVSLLVPDNFGALQDVTLGLPSFEAYLQAKPSFFGSTVGRYANRIAQGRFSIGETKFNVPQNLGMHHLHGGFNNFQEQVWNAAQPDEATIVFTHLSPDGEEGYPGNLNVKVTYSLTKNNELQAAFEAATDKPTVLNLTNHAYFNLNGQGSGNILNHQLTINADGITETDADAIPTGRLMPVANAPFDFRQPKTIGRDLHAAHQLLRFGNGYDHNFVLNKNEENDLNFAARAVGDKSGIAMEVYTTEPGMQLYGANFLKGTTQLRSGAMDEQHCGFCLEAQHFPDSPNQPHFPTTILNPGEKFFSQTAWRFV